MSETVPRAFIGLTTAASVPAPATPVRAPEGAPNVVDRVERDAGTTLVEPPRPPILDALHSE